MVLLASTDVQMDGIYVIAGVKNKRLNVKLFYCS